MPRDETITLTLCVHTSPSSDNAVFVSEDGNAARGLWLPLAYVEVHMQGRLQIRWTPAEITMPLWLAKKKGLV